MRRREGRACRVRSHSVLTTEHAEAASRHTEATELTLHPQTRSVCSVTAFGRSVCSVVKTPYPASGRLTRSARRHEDTESGLRVASARLHPPSVHSGGSRSCATGCPTPRPGTQCTRAALGAWRSNGFGPQYHVSPGGTRSVASVHTDCRPPICAIRVRRSPYLCHPWWRRGLRLRGGGEGCGRETVERKMFKKSKIAT